MPNKLQVEYVSIDEIKTYENNAKLHPAEQIEQIKESIKEFGFNDPIAIDKDNVIIEGHGRYIACKELGITEVPIIRLNELSDEQKRAYMLVHNKLTMNTDFDIELLNDELENIFDIDMSKFDFSIEQEIDEEEVEEVDIPEVEEVTSKLGDIYQLGNHRVMCGDSTKGEDIRKAMNKLPRNKVIRLGGMTDCFQPLERIHRVTYKTIKMLNKRKIPYLIVTKSNLVAEYTDILDKDLAHIQITCTTLDDELYKRLKYEKASLPSERIKAILELQDKGYDIAIRLSPLIEEFIDFDKLNSLGINKAIVEFLRVNHWIEKWFDIDYSKYKITENGYRHLPLSEKKRIYAKIKIPSISVCEDVTQHYEYWKTINPNKEDCCNLR